MKKWLMTLVDSHEILHILCIGKVTICGGIVVDTFDVLIGFLKTITCSLECALQCDIIHSRIRDIV